MITCYSCKAQKTDEEFAFKRGSVRNTRCKECTNAYAKSHYAKNKQYYLNKSKLHSASFKIKFNKFIDWLKSIPCADCNMVYDPICMDFDHLRDKEFNIAHQCYGIAADKLMEEISKCQVVCSNCHRIRTRNRRTVL